MKHKVSIAILTLAFLSGIAFSASASAVKNGVSEYSLETTPVTSFFKKFFGGEKQEEKVEEVDPVEKYKDDFAEESKKHTATRFKSDPIKYEIKIPKDWAHTTANLGLSTDINSRLLDTLDHFQGELIVGGGRPSLSIEAIKINHEILAEHWLQNYIFKNGHASENPVEARNENQAQVSFIYIKGGTSFRAVVRAYIIQDRLLLIKFEAPINADEKISTLGELAVESFTIASANLGAVEKTEDFSFRNGLKFSFPSSWEPRNHSLRDPNRLAIEFHNVTQNETLKGLVRVISYRRNEEYTNDFIINDLQKQVKTDLKLKISQLENSTPLSVGLAYDIAHIERYAVSREKRLKVEYELWLAVLGKEDWVTFIYLLTPNKNLDFYSWARNTRMLDLLITSIN
ncbi:MAG: hypothetical protein ACQEQL_04940 [Pseudomonadota bacterium]